MWDLGATGEKGIKISDIGCGWLCVCLRNKNVEKIGENVETIYRRITMYAYLQLFFC